MDPAAAQPCPRLSGCCFDPRGRVVFFVQQRISRFADTPRTYAQLLSQLRLPQQSAPQSKFPSPTPAAPPSTPSPTAASNVSYFTVASSLYSRSELAASPMTMILPDFYRIVRPAPRRQTERTRTTSVFIANAAPLMPLDPALARAYSLNGDTDLKTLCASNEKAATDAGRKDLATLWHVIGIVVSPAAQDCGWGTERGLFQRGIPWPQAQMGRTLIA